MARKALQVVLPLILAMGPSMAAEFWETKPSSEWNDKEVKRLMNRSPWAKEVTAEFDSGRMGQESPGGGGGRAGGRGGGDGIGQGGMGRGGGMRGSGGAATGDPGGADGGGIGAPGGGMRGPDGRDGGRPGGPGGAGMDGPRIAVRLLSSGPMQQAALKTDGMKELAEWSKEFYVVAVSGMRAGMGMSAGGPAGEGRAPGSQPGGVDPQQRIAMMKERMMESSTLQIGGRGPMQPSRVEMVRGETGPVTILLFPRVSDVTIADKEVQFQTATGPFAVKVKFPLRDMSVKGKLEL